MKYSFNLPFLLASILLINCNTTKKQADRPTRSTSAITIAFGSCSDEDKKQFLWDDIVGEQPDIWIWLGDNIYGDTENMDELRAKYLLQKSNTDYQELRKNTTILGVWDDHDYGLNDAGKEYSKKEESQQELLDFLDVPNKDPRRSRAGVYHSYLLENDFIKTKIILLDVRYFRDELITVDGVKQANADGTILGTEQWKWLENELRNSKADIHLIGTGIQVIPEEHRWEKWANFPNEREKLLNLIADLKVKNPIFITGDRHSGEISRLNWKGQVMYDITSSSLTNPRSSTTFEANKYRLGKMVFKENYGILQIEKKGKLNIRAYLKSDNQSIEVEKTLNF